MRFVYLAFAAVILLQTLFSVNAQGNANFSSPTAKVGDKIPGCYVVLFKKQDFKQKASFNNSAAAAAIEALEFGAKSFALKFGSLKYEFKGELNGFTVCDVKSESSLVNEIRKNSQVEFIEQDSIMTMSGMVTQATSSWGLDRIDQRTGLNGNFVYDNKDASVDVYVLDSGVNVDHPELPRAKFGLNAVPGSENGDRTGHGTFIAGVIASKTYGICKHCRIISVKVMGDSSGTTSSFINGVNYVIDRNSRSGRPSVASISLSYSGVEPIADAAVNRMINAGISVVIAAGNQNRDACNYSPQRVPAAITVGGTDRNDARYAFSNFGKCVDIHAPGVLVTSIAFNSNTQSYTFSGTSFAAPFVTGVVAAYRSYNPRKSVQEVRDFIVGSASLNKISGLPNGTPNRLIYSKF
jgi:serine protease